MFGWLWHSFKSLISHSRTGSSGQGGGARIKISERQRRFQHPCPYLAMDMGGSLTKVAVLVPRGCPFGVGPSFRHAQRRSLTIDVEGGQIRFLNFHTEPEHLSKFLEEHGECNTQSGRLRVTGGGAVRFDKLLRQRSSLVPQRVDEIVALVTGLNYIRRRSAKDGGLAFHVCPETGERIPVPAGTKCFDTFPYLLVNIGTGTSFVLVENAVTFRRVGGSSVGGGAFMGLGRFLLGKEYEGEEQEYKTLGITTRPGSSEMPEQFDRLLDLAVNGQPDRVDMLVRDIYGAGDKALGLDAKTLAASFGKCEPGAEKGDVTSAWLRMICLTVAQLANLYCRLYRCRQAVFGGNFLRGQSVPMGIISGAMEYWSGGRIPATFLKHEGFLGALGALVSSSEDTVGGRGRPRAARQRPTSVVPFPASLDRFGEYARRYPVEHLSPEVSDMSDDVPTRSPRCRKR